MDYYSRFWVVVSEYYGEEKSIHQASIPYASREEAEARRDEMDSYGHGNEVEVRRLDHCIRDGIE